MESDMKKNQFFSSVIIIYQHW